MPARHTHFETRARQDIQRGVEQLADAVKITLGPWGCTVLLHRPFGSPLSTKDEVTVAEESECTNRFKNSAHRRGARW